MFSSSESIIIKDNKDSHNQKSRTQHHEQHTILNRQRAATWSETQLEKLASTSASEKGGGGGGGGGDLGFGAGKSNTTRRKAKSFHHRHRRQHSQSSTNSIYSTASASASASASQLDLNHGNQQQPQYMNSPGASATGSFYSPTATPTYNHSSTAPPSTVERGGSDPYSGYGYGHGHGGGGGGAGSSTVSMMYSLQSCDAFTLAPRGNDNANSNADSNSSSNLNSIPAVEGMKEDHLKAWLSKNYNPEERINKDETGTRVEAEAEAETETRIIGGIGNSVLGIEYEDKKQMRRKQDLIQNELIGGKAQQQQQQQQQQAPPQPQVRQNQHRRQLSFDFLKLPTFSVSDSTGTSGGVGLGNGSGSGSATQAMTFKTPSQTRKKLSEMVTPRASGARHLRQSHLDTNFGSMDSMGSMGIGADEIIPLALSYHKSKGSVSLPSTPISLSLARSEHSFYNDDAGGNLGVGGGGGGGAMNIHVGAVSENSGGAVIGNISSGMNAAPNSRDGNDNTADGGGHDHDKNVPPNSLSHDHHRNSHNEMEVAPALTAPEMNVDMVTRTATSAEYPPNLNIVQGPGPLNSISWTEETGTSSLDTTSLGLSDLGGSGSLSFTGTGTGTTSTRDTVELGKQWQHQEHPHLKEDASSLISRRNPPASLMLQDSDSMNMDGKKVEKMQHLRSYRSHDDAVLHSDDRVDEGEIAMEDPGSEMKETAYDICDSETSLGSYESSTGYRSEKMKFMSTSSDTDSNILPLRQNSSVFRHLQDESLHRNADMEDKGPLEKALSWIWKKCWFCFNSPPKLSWSRVSAAVVRNSPCFWIGCGRLETSATDRMILTRLNMLSAVFALWQFSIGVLILVVFLSETIAERGEGIEGRSKYREALSPNFWMMSGSLLLLSVVGLLLFISMLLAIPAIRKVNLVGAIRFLWVLYWIIPLQICFVIALWDYHNVTEVWIKHWWASPSMAWFRRLYCEEGTANEQCAIRYFQENDPKAEEWCMEEYGATNCMEIRDAAVARMNRAGNIFLYTNVIVGLVLVFILLLSLGLLEGIISAPIVQRSKETNIPFWLTFPAIGCFSLGLTLRFSPSSLLSEESGSRIYWIGLSYIISGASFTVSALLGWFISAKTVLNIRDKRQKEIAVYVFIIVVILTIGAVACIFVASVIFSLVEEAITETQRAIIACFVDAADSCSGCNCTLEEVSSNTCQLDDMACPEWSRSDVTRIVATQLKQSITLSAIFAIYAFTALRFGFMLRTSISRYEIDYV